MIYNFYIDGKFTDVRKLASDKEAVYHARKLADLHENKFITCISDEGLVTRACMIIWRATNK